jgi:hypothetical protein
MAEHSAKAPAMQHGPMDATQVDGEANSRAALALKRL